MTSRFILLKVGTWMPNFEEFRDCKKDLCCRPIVAVCFIWSMTEGN